MCRRKADLFTFSSNIFSVLLRDISVISLLHYDEVSGRNSRMLWLFDTDILSTGHQGNITKIH